jgi:hypothetical protein
MLAEKKKEYYSHLIEQLLRDGTRLLYEISEVYERSTLYPQIAGGVLEHMRTVGLILHDLKSLERDIKKGKLDDATLALSLCLAHSLKKAQKSWAKFFRKEKLGILFL